MSGAVVTPPALCAACSWNVVQRKAPGAMNDMALTVTPVSVSVRFISPAACARPSHGAALAAIADHWRVSPVTGRDPVRCDVLPSLFDRETCSIIRRAFVSSDGTLRYGARKKSCGGMQRDPKRPPEYERPAFGGRHAFELRGWRR